MAQRTAWSNAPTQAIQSGSQRHCRPSCQRDPVPQPPGRSDASMEHSAAGMICCHVLHICHMLHMGEALLHHVMPASQLDLAQQIMHPHPTTRAAPRQRGLGETSGLTHSHVYTVMFPQATVIFAGAEVMHVAHCTAHTNRASTGSSASGTLKHATCTCASTSTAQPAARSVLNSVATLVPACRQCAPHPWPRRPEPNLSTSRRIPHRAGHLWQLGASIRAASL
jgi:hypothetical protein